MVGFDGSVHDVFDRRGADRALGDDHQAHGVANQVQQGVVGDDFGVFAENRARLGVFDMGFQCHRALGFEGLHHLGDAKNRVQVIVFVVLGALEGAAYAGKYRLDYVWTVANEHTANG